MSDASELDQELDDNDVNRIDDADGGDEPAPTAASVLDLLVTSLVDDPDAVSVDSIEQRDRVRLAVRVGPDALGRDTGQRGRVANAIPTVVRGAAVPADVNAAPELQDRVGAEPGHGRPPGRTDAVEG